MTGDHHAGGSTFDESLWPVVVVRTPPRIMDSTTFDEHCRKSFGYYERGQSFALVFDVRESPVLPADQRRVIAELTDRCTAKYPGVRMVTAIVVASAVQRGVVKAITWLTRQPVPIEVVANVADGVAWCQKKLAALRAEKRAAL